MLPILQSQASESSYSTYINGIGVVEVAAGEVLVAYANNIDNLYIDKDGLNMFNEMLSCFHEALVHHKTIKPPEAQMELHLLIGNILKQHAEVFKNIIIGFEKADKEHMKKAFEIYDQTKEAMNNAKILLSSMDALQ